MHKYGEEKGDFFEVKVVDSDDAVHSIIFPFGPAYLAHKLDVDLISVQNGDVFTWKKGEDWKGLDIGDEVTHDVLKIVPKRN